MFSLFSKKSTNRVATTVTNRVATTVNSEDTEAGRSVLDMRSSETINSLDLDEDVRAILNIPSEEDRTVKLCEANPITKSGKRMHLTQMLGSISIPVVLLISISGLIFGLRFKEYRDTSMIRNTVVFSIELANVIHTLQSERDRSALYISSLDINSKAELMQQYHYTDEVIANLSQLPSWEIEVTHLSYLKSGEALQSYLHKHRYSLDPTYANQQDELKFYTDIIATLITWFLDSIPSESTGTVWKLLVSLNEIVASKELCGVERAYGSIYFVNKGFGNREDYFAFVEAQDVAKDSLASSREYSHSADTKFQELIGEETQFMQTLSKIRHQIRLDPFGEKLDRETYRVDYKWWYGNMTLYIDQLLIVQQHIAVNIRQILANDEHNDQLVLYGLSTIIGIVLLICPTVYTAFWSLTMRIQKFSMSLIRQKKKLKYEQKRTDTWLYSMLPRSVALKLKNKEHVGAETFDAVTIFCSSLLDFTTICSMSTPKQVIDMLDILYTCFNEEIKKYDVFTVDTIADAYMVVSGVPDQNGNENAVQIATMALAIMLQILAMDIPHLPGTRFNIRVGCHSGTVVAGIVGSQLLKYCLFGETVRIAELMESAGTGRKVQISQATKQILTEVGGFTTRRRKKRISEEMQTYWLTGLAENAPATLDEHVESDGSDDVVAGDLGYLSTAE